MAYVLTVPKKHGICVNRTARIWYNGTNHDGMVYVSVVTELDVVTKCGDTWCKEEEPRRLLVDPGQRIRIVDERGVHVEFLMEVQDDGYGKFLIFKTAVDGKSYTHVIKGAA